MFEDALIESSHSIKTTSRYWSVPAILVNGAALCALTMWPLLHPEALPTQVLSALLTAPAAPLSTPPPATPMKSPARSSSLALAIQAPSHIPQMIARLNEAVVGEAATGISALNNMTGMQWGEGMEGIASGTGHLPVVKAPPPARVNVSSGVMAGRLLLQITPQYPAIAKTTRTQGTIVLLATIAKNGAIENLRVLSGPALLQQAALEAVRAWRYVPYQLNGEPVEVETTINVVFKLSSD